MWIRIWSGNTIVTDLVIDQGGGGSWVPKPEMPNNAEGHPDLELDPWRQYIRHKRNDVEEYGRGPVADAYSAIDDADDI